MPLKPTAVASKELALKFFIARQHANSAILLYHFCLSVRP